MPWPPLADLDTKIGLRPWGAADDDPAALARGWADPEVIRWTSVPADASEEAARNWIRGEEIRRSRGLAMDLVIAELDEPRTIHGEIGLIMVEPEQRWAEMGYWLADGSRGAGRAGAAALLFADWVLRELPVNRLFARTNPDNPKAGAVAAAGGLTEAGALETGTVVWVRDRPG
ncbi:GNAT family N-acetyltransferase [Aquihabitans sp. McL0605]|uniref:GNAT family N-acetyltransferase n=1 Tax=Aquihabitans sp. McL0605 TaxID=3415671 RepID=UPI003CF109D7